MKRITGIDQPLPPAEKPSTTMAEAIDAAAPNAAPDPAQVWRDSLARLMAEYGLMDRARRKAFLVGLGFATSSVQLAACNLARTDNPNAAGAFRHLAATISGAALALDVIPTAKNARRKAKRR